MAKKVGETGRQPRQAENNDGRGEGKQKGNRDTADRKQENRVARIAGKRGKKGEIWGIRTRTITAKPIDMQLTSYSSRGNALLLHQQNKRLVKCRFFNVLEKHVVPKNFAITRSANAQHTDIYLRQ